MAAEKQSIRLHILIAFTLVVIAFGVTRLLRMYRQRRERTDYARTEARLRAYVRGIIGEEQEAIEDFARQERGRLSRDAAALLAQARHLVAESRRRRPGRPDLRDSTTFDRIRRNFSRLQRGEEAVFPRGESFLRAYYQPTDGSFRPYRICLPSDYSPRRAYPVIVTLAGGRSTGGATCYEGAVSVKPTSPAESPEAYPDERDALGALAEVRRLYSTDPRQVYLVGRGAGTERLWRLAVHYPDMFAGVVALAGEPVAPRVPLPLAPTKGGRNSWDELKEFLLAAGSSVCYAQNLQHVPVVVAEGSLPERMERAERPTMVRRLRQLGQVTEYLRFPGSGLRSLPRWVEEYALARVLGRPAVDRPSRFLYRTAHLRHNRAWWLCLDRLGDPVAFSAVEVEVEGGRAHVSTENVSALTVDLSEMPEEAKEVVVDHTPLGATGGAASLSVEKRGGEWVPARQERLLKHRGLSGPVSDVFRDPFVVVYGTGGSELENQICRLEARRFGELWKLRCGTEPRIKKDTELTERDIQRFNLILIGGPRLNSISSDVIEEVPVKLTPEAVVLDGTEYTGSDIGVMFCYPNPLRRGRMVAMVAGTRPAALYQAFQRFGLWLAPPPPDGQNWFDYAVYDSRTVGPGTFPVAGFFNNAWRFAGEYAWKASPDAVAQVAPQGFPKLPSAADADEGKVSLSKVRPAGIRQPAGAVGFDRSFAGRPIRLGNGAYDEGLGVKPPSEISFQLGGRFRRFTAGVGLTKGFGGPPAEARGLTFAVRGDGELLGRPVTVRALGQERRNISADVRGVNVLTLSCRAAGGTPAAAGPGAWAAPTLTR